MKHEINGEMNVPSHAIWPMPEEEDYRRELQRIGGQNLERILSEKGLKKTRNLRNKKSFFKRSVDFSKFASLLTGTVLLMSNTVNFDYLSKIVYSSFLKKNNPVAEYSGIKHSSENLPFLSLNFRPYKNLENPLFKEQEFRVIGKERPPQFFGEIEKEARLDLRGYEKYFSNPSRINSKKAKPLSEILMSNPEEAIGSMARIRADFIKGNKDIKENFIEGVERLKPYLPTIKSIFIDKGVPEELIYLSIVESGFRNDVRSHANALGPWQFMKATAIKNGLMVDEEADERKNPILAAEAAAAKLANSYQIFGDWCLATMAYNVGDHGVGKRLIGREYSCAEFFSAIGKNLEDHVKAEMKKSGKKIGRKEIKKIASGIKTPRNLMEITTYFSRLIATLKNLEELEPDVLKTPASNEHYEVYRVSYDEALREHVVSKGDSLYSIAKKIVPVGIEPLINKIKEYNGIDGSVIHPKEIIRIPPPERLMDVARLVGMNYEELKYLNPHLNPPDKIPSGVRVIVRKNPKAEKIIKTYAIGTQEI